MYKKAIKIFDEDKFFDRKEELKKSASKIDDILDEFRTNLSCWKEEHESPKGFHNPHETAERRSNTEEEVVLGIQDVIEPLKEAVLNLYINTKDEKLRDRLKCEAKHIKFVIRETKEYLDCESHILFEDNAYVAISYLEDLLVMLTQERESPYRAKIQDYYVPLYPAAFRRNHLKPAAIEKTNKQRGR